MRALLVVLSMVAGCNGPPLDEEVPVCDGRLQPGEASIDSPWDADEDGYFDFSDLYCSETYGLARFDCDDSDPAVHVDAVEIICNGVDDDCNFQTPDGEDLDGDGANHCVDCDDADPERFPAAEEVCWDDIDNDCDGVVDPECGLDYNGIFELTVPLQYECAYGLVDLEIVELEVVWDPPLLRMTPRWMVPAVELVGTVEEDGSFRASVQLEKACNQKYGIMGTFSSADEFSGEFRAVWGRNTCLGCANPFAVFIEGVRVTDGKKAKVD